MPGDRKSKSKTTYSKCQVMWNWDMLFYITSQWKTFQLSAEEAYTVTREVMQKWTKSNC